MFFVTRDLAVAKGFEHTGRQPLAKYVLAAQNESAVEQFLMAIAVTRGCEPSPL